MSSQALRHGAWMLLWIVCEGLAAAPPALPGLDLAGAVRRSLETHPELAVREAEQRVQAGVQTQAGLRPNPELSLEIEDVLGSGARRGFDAAQTTLSLRQVLERGAREQRLAVAAATSGQLEAALAERRVQLAADTAQRFHQVLAEQALLELSREAVQLAGQGVEAAARRVQAAQVPAAELARAQAQAARARLEQEDVEHRLEVARYRLAASWGAGAPDFGEALGALQTLPPAMEFAALQSALEASPGLQRFLAERALREAERQQLLQQRRPAWTLSAGLRRFEDGDDLAAVAGLSLPLGLRDPVAGQLASAEARLDQLEAERAAARVEWQSQLYAWVQELAHARHVAETLDHEVLPALQAALEETEHAYRRGRYGYAEWLAAQRELLEARRARIEAALDAHRSATDIDRLTAARPALPDPRP